MALEQHLTLLGYTEIQMSKYDDMKPSKPFEPTPWLIVVLILMCIVLVSVVDNCGMAS